MLGRSFPKVLPAHPSPTPPPPPPCHSFQLGTCVEIGLPILFISILVALRTTTEDKWKVGRRRRPGQLDGDSSPSPPHPNLQCTEDGGCTYESFRLSDEGFQPLQGSGLSADCPSFHVSYAPNTTAANQAVMARFAKLDNLNRETTKLIVRGFATEEEMLDSIAVLSTNFSAASVIPGCRAGVFFKESAGNNKFHFDIRLDSTPGGFDTDDKFSKTWMTKFTFPQFLGLGRSGRRKVLSLSIVVHRCPCPPLTTFPSLPPPPPPKPNRAA